MNALANTSSSPAGRNSPANAGQTLPPERLTREEVVSLIRMCPDHTPSGKRDRALLTVMYRGGLKLGEALGLQVRDLDRSRGELTVTSSRGSRVVGLDPVALRILDQWLDSRDALGLGDGFLMCSLKGARLMPGYVRTTLPKLAKEAGVVRRVHPQAFRHTHAAELVLEGLPIPLIQAQLGLANLGATEHYLRKLRIPLPDRIAAMRSRRWLADDGSNALGDSVSA